MSDDIIKIIVAPQDAGQRLDKFCTDKFEGLSRERVKHLIENESIRIKGISKIKPALKIEADWVISCKIPEVDDATPQPENIPLDILFEDNDVIVINKAAGMVVHPAAGNWTGTLVNALLYHCGDTLSGIGGIKRPGIVHRLDKDTSGVMIVAKNDFAHAHLSAQLADRSLSRIYLALVWDIPIPIYGTIDLPIGRDHKNRLKKAVKRGNFISHDDDDYDDEVKVKSDTRNAITHYKVLETFDNAMALVECRLETGRTHQIRVHMQAKGHPLIGDPLYGAQKTLKISRATRLSEEFDKDAIVNFPRQALHAHQLSFIHPRNEDTMEFTADLASDIAQIINR